jgi:transposase
VYFRVKRLHLRSSTPAPPARSDARWEHEHILDAVQRRLDEHSEKMRQRREMVEHPFGTIKARMGARHFLMKTLPRVAAEMDRACAYNLTRLMNINGRPTALSGDEGIVVADMRPYPVAQPPTTAGSRIRSASGRKKRPPNSAK